MNFIQRISINRNIVECKETSTRIEMWLDGCINRNIVECKEICRKCWGCWRKSVLIETLWNVKSVLTRGANGTLLY